MAEPEIVAREVILTEFGKPRIVCEFCNISFGTRGNLYTHLRKYHHFKVLVQGNQTCVLCNDKFRTIALLHEHMQTEHSNPLNFIDETFYSEKDFQEWKDKIEKETLSSYRIRNTHVTECGISHSYYICHRSGHYKTKQNRVRHVKATGSIKSGITCPAVMTVSTQTVDGISEIKVRFQSVHMGHDMETHTLRLTKQERENLAACLKLGISMDTILADARQNPSPTNRYSLLTRKHLHNICRDFRIQLNHNKPEYTYIPGNVDNIVEISDSSIMYEDCLEIDTSNNVIIEQADILVDTSNEVVLQQDQETVVSSLLQLQDHDYSEEFKNRKSLILSQIKDLMSRIEKWDPKCPLPDVEEHLKALNARLDISSSSHLSSHLLGPLPILTQVTTDKQIPKQKKQRVKKIPKKYQQNEHLNSFNM